MNILCPRPESTKNYLSLPKIKLLVLVLLLSSCNVFKMMGKKSDIYTVPESAHGYIIYHVFNGTNNIINIFNTKTASNIVPKVSGIELMDINYVFKFKKQIYIAASTTITPGNTQIYRYNPSTETTVHAISLNAGSAGAKIAAVAMTENYLYFLNIQNSQPTLYRYSGSGSALANVTTGVPLTAPVNMNGYIYNGKLHLCNLSVNKVAAVNLSTYVINDLPSVGLGGCSPDATYFGDGEIFAETNDGIESLSFTSFSATAVLTGFFDLPPSFELLSPPGKIALSGDTNNNAANELWIFDMETKKMENLYPDGYAISTGKIIYENGIYYFSTFDGIQDTLYRTKSGSSSVEDIFSDTGLIHNFFVAGDSLYIVAESSIHKINENDASSVVVSNIDPMNSHFIVAD